MTGNRNDADHQPVLVRGVVRLLATATDGAYIDLTAGFGGHLKAMAKVLGPAARLYGVDRDPQAVARLHESLGDSPRFRKVWQASFGNLLAQVGQLEDKVFDGVFLDLGISSGQLDSAERGFSFRFDGPLDMRFDQHSGERSAADLINSADEKQLIEIIRGFGEEKSATKLAEAIVRERQTNTIRTTYDLARVVTATVTPARRIKALARVFQAFRIAVNRELDELTRVLPAALTLLKGTGRLAVISYHSLEDRIVKRFFQREAKVCLCPPHLPICVCNHTRQLRIITRRVVVPSDDEKASNPRSRSARLRVAQKIEP